jgi:hypothetical protein
MAKAKVSKLPEIIYELEITLLETAPRIWRRLAVPGNITLAKLHDIVQEVMGWEECHLHEFRIGKNCYGKPDPEMDFGQTRMDEGKVKLQDVLVRKGMKFLYTYDFGDGWEHELKVVAMGPPDPDVKYPICLVGERACPPEDCGGVYGYDHLLEVIADPQNEEYEEMMDWLGDEFDPNAFDLKAVNNRLAYFRR